MIVDINEIERVLRYFKEINDTPLSEIKWTNGDNLLYTSNDAIVEFQYMGLSNKDFPSVMGWMPDGIGIRVSTVTIGSYDEADLQMLHLPKQSTGDE